MALLYICHTQMTHRNKKRKEILNAANRYKSQTNWMGPLRQRVPKGHMERNCPVPSKLCFHNSAECVDHHKNNCITVLDAKYDNRVESQIVLELSVLSGSITKEELGSTVTTNS
ncbi:hypothetical protein LOAG_12160 [Loa loa]|uniref:Uncharacterized protein n=1 Tax=Loa loa TaxID=7209 RepID=A0A1S0TMW6_LOALO|nr:hypothetical protein LOAG_12160 [Loa loa]EFO16348.1 hypothetical protein LOAG_12160 [Loa loa]